ncbi:membrane protein [Thalassotalea insulae]|uniref:Membrane protein n=1 Tax=Thalassotalea insulae TaxID=2056778 RepID=A0ABQ6GPA6_9GAMM|nr:type II CAAX endopeptidase family protein [Thalassotalea insulae]GLX76974.1 membrane protein [Thalassotalea insulae]
MNNNKIIRYINSLIFNQQQKLRNGWWILLFIALVAATRPLYSFIKPELITAGLSDTMLEALSLVLITLVTWICIALRKEGFKDVGLAINGQWFYQLALGCLIGFGQIVLIVIILMLFGAVAFNVSSNISLSGLLSAAYVMLCAVILEELLFRGFIFQRLVNGTSFWFAQLLFALVFAYGHWDNPDMTGVVKWFASLDLALAAMVFGLAYYRTQSLALPIGLHFGWNYFQGHLFGFGVSGHQLSGVLEPSFTDFPVWFTGGSFGPEASMLSVLVDLGLLLILWRWQGIAHNQNKIIKHEQASNNQVPLNEAN